MFILVQNYQEHSEEKEEKGKAFKKSEERGKKKKSKKQKREEKTESTDHSSVSKHCNGALHLCRAVDWKEKCCNRKCLQGIHVEFLAMQIVGFRKWDVIVDLCCLEM